MYYSIDASNGTPIYLQIVQQTKFAIADRTLIPGQKIPSVRFLAKQLAVNPNTIQRAFQQLQADGVIESLRGLGQVVRQEAPDLCRREQSRWLEENVKSLVTQALNSGVDPPVILDLVRSAIDQHQQNQEN